MAKKKRPQLKATVQRGFATTSLPKKQAAPDEPVQAPSEPQAPVASAETSLEHTDAAPSDPLAVEEGGRGAYCPEEEEMQALKNLVQLVYPKVEKETLRRTKTISFQQRFAKSLTPISFDPDVCGATLAWVRNDQAPLSVPFPSDLGDDTRLQALLGVAAAPETEAKTLEYALTTWELLLSLGFSRAHASLAIEHAPTLELEDCVAWLLARLEPDEYRKLHFHVDAPQETPVAKAAALDTSMPPSHPAYEFQRIERPTQAPEPSARTSAPAEVHLQDVDAEQIEQLRRTAQAFVRESQAMLDSEAPCVDTLEHPIDAWCTGRILQLQVDQERARRRKALGGYPDAQLAEALGHDDTEKQLKRLSERASDLLQQSEIQPQFHRAMATQRFRERMRQKEMEEAEKARQAEEEAAAERRRRADLDQLHEPPAEAPQAEQQDDTVGEASDDEMGAMLEEGLGLLDEPTEAQGTTVRLRDIPAQSGSRTPRSLLSDVLKHVDAHARIKYVPLSSGAVHRTQLEIHWTAKGGLPPLMDIFKLTSEGCATRAMSEDYAATIALNCFGRERGAQRMLSTSFRDIWDELEALRTEQRDAFLRDEVLHVQHLLQQRASRPWPSAKGAQRNKAPKASSHATVQRPRRDADPAVAAMWAGRVASESYQRMLPGREDLPIFRARSAILESVHTSQVVVLSGETGCGKSTQLPAYLMEDALARGEPCKIYVTEPRRISAISLAERVSQEMGEAPKSVGTGDSLVGYAIRLENQVGPQARLVYATTGIVLRMLESSVLDHVTHIIVDEVHERTIESDFLLIVLKTLMQQRPDLKIVLMSATLDAERISAYFGGCPTLAVPGRTFPVDVHFLEDVLEMCDYTLEQDSPYARQDEKLNKVDVQAAELDMDAEEEARVVGPGADGQRYQPKTLDTLARLNEHKIHYELIGLLLLQLLTDPRWAPFRQAILVFLPGMGEIRECLRVLSEHALFQKECMVHVLHSSVASEDQSAAFLPPPPGQHKIVLATNIAETGITIPDITCVIDTGRHREMRYDEKRKISRLVECFVAQSNAKQRRGRAGRVQHGVCFHMFTRKRHDEYMDAHPLPEMLRLSLQELALQLKVMPLQIGAGIEDALSQALDPPEAANVQRAIASLVEVEALTPQEQITPLGRHLCHMPLDVHLSKFLLIASLFQCLDTALSIAAVLNTKSPFLTSMGREAGRGRLSFQTHDSDFLTLASMFRAWRHSVHRHQGQAFCAAHSLSADVLYQMEELRQQYFAYLVDTGFVTVDPSVRNDLARRRARHGRPKLLDIPAHLNTHGLDASVVTLALVAAMYPKLLVVDEGSQQMRTLTNNQPATVHPSSVNARKALGAPSMHFVLYHSIVYSHRLYAWETAVVDDRMVLLVGGEAEWRHTARSVTLDHNRVRMAAYDGASLVALRVLRFQLRRMMQASFQAPDTPWTPAEETIFALVRKLLGGQDKPL
ncbi:RNA helicase [Malassezia caprae]|uniref:RNA helicase n=1 Tax=Malassezia caprae TaxID=1381934 RepID=A0AAF0E386_9BASI|nr:RNA helicase [Malassezia caprae]